jgi:hypothetical protein
MDNETILKLLTEAEVILASSDVYFKYKEAAFPFVLNLCLYRWQSQEAERQLRMQALSWGTGDKGANSNA